MSWRRIRSSELGIWRRDYERRTIVNKIGQFQITGMTISGFKSYEEPTELAFGSPTTITNTGYQMSSQYRNR